MPEPAKHDYDDRFFDYIGGGARRSARHIIPFLRQRLQVSSVLDIGCGRGVWVEEWRRNGVADALGVDGDYVGPDRLAVPQENFAACDLAEPIRLGRRFDLVQSLEVAEHIPAARADVFIANIVAHGDVILFSAAVPGQGGEFHVNEQPYEYWRKKFFRHGFEVLDCIRRDIAGVRAIEPWYRYNILLYVRKTALDRIPPELLRTRLPPGRPIDDLAPLPWRLRRLTLQRLPQPVVERFARLKHAMVRMLPG